MKGLLKTLLFGLLLGINNQALAECTQFTGAAQTWDNSGNLKVDGSAKITGSVPVNRVGFTIVDAHNNGGGSCDTGRCVADASLMVPRYSFTSVTSGSSDFIATNGTHSITPGYYKEIKIGGSAKVTFAAGDYWAEKITMYGNSRSYMAGQVYLNSGEHIVKSSAEANNKVSASSSENGIPKNLNIIVHGDGKEAKFEGNARARAFVIAEGKITIDGSSELTGAAATGGELKVTGNARLYGDISSCDDTYTLQISPASASAIVGKTIPVTFSITDGQGGVDTSVDGTYNLSHDGPAQVCWKESASTSCLNDTSALSFQNGTATYYLYSSVVAEVDITATWVEKSAVTASAGPYSFEANGYAFEPSPLTMISGQDTAVTIKAVDENGNVVTTYEGSKTLSLTATTKVLPSTGTIDATLLTELVTFTEGEAQISVNYADAGKVTLNIEETSDGYSGEMIVHSRPHTFAICDITSSGLNNGYSGTSISGPGFARAGETFSVVIRPLTWTGSAISGDSSGDSTDDLVSDSLCSHPVTPNYFTEGGQVAKVTLSHALHTPSGKAAGVLSQTASDSTYEFTNRNQAQNGLSVGGLSWNEVGSLWLQAQYAGYALGGVEQGVAAIGRFYPYEFVVTSRTVSEGQSSFTYMEQEFGVQFEVAARSAGGTTTTNYEFMTAYQMLIGLTGLDSTKISPAVNDLTTRLDTSAITAPGWQSDWSGGTLGLPLSVLKFNRVETAASPRKTVPDGPYSLQIGLEVSSGTVDCDQDGCTDFQTLDTYRNNGTVSVDGTTLGSPLDVRYGRLKLFDIGGVSGADLPVPVEAEYWNGSDFVTNPLDSGSAFNGANYCRKELWPGDGASQASLSGAGSVTGGESSALSASQNVADRREQVKLWLRIGTAQSGHETGLSCEGVNTGGQEYLFYNWDGRGDESPRAVLTFGVYRGNDRVLFRGEPGVY